MNRLSTLTHAKIPVTYNASARHQCSCCRPADIATYTNHFGPDRYTFRHGGLVGIVLSPVIIHAPQQASNQLAAQERWLQAQNS